MTLHLFTIEIRSENDVVLARQKARTLAAALKFDAQDQTRIATAVSEIARNTFQYGGGGKAEFRIEDLPEKMLIITLRDEGKGIANLEEILNGRYVSQTGMGLGILGAKRLMDHFVIETGPRGGTQILLGKKISPRFSRLSPHQLEHLLSQTESASQDPYQELKQQNKELLNALDELRRNQEELSQLNRELDETNRGVVALYAELDDKADFLQRASELKSRFLSNMSHEFRTPLNSILALSQILLDRLDGDLSPEQEKQVNFIRASAQDLTDLVNDLLDLAKVEAGKVTIRPSNFAVDSLFGGLRGMLRPLLAQNSSVNLVFDDPLNIPELYSDEPKISQILRNFISNALKFTERGEVRVGVERGQGDVLIFSVSDTGMGIAPENQERIFEEWAQVEGNFQKAVKGTGLGLPLSRKLAQMLGGDIYVRSQLGIGSTFYAAIPIHYSVDTEPVSIPDVKRELDSNRHPVLVVEDNREALFVYESYLKGTPFQMIPARDLKDARKALRSFRPAAIILDVLLQGEHSWELLQEIKHNPLTSKIPVLVVTVVENRDKAVGLGADAFRAKPVERGWLVEQLERVITPRSNKQILVIDDDEVARYVLKSVLDNEGLKFTEASGGREGLRMAREQKPDLVVLDLVMPDVSGFEVLKLLKCNSETARIPVIIYSSKNLTENERLALQDAVAIVPKGSESREIAAAQFAEAFRKAGLALTTTGNEAQHV